MKQFIVLILFTLFSLFGLFLVINRVRSAAIPDLYFYANTKRVAVSNGWSFTLAVEPSQAFPSSTAIAVTFPDYDDGYWCRTAGALTVLGVTSTPVDISGTPWNIDLALPGSLSATCIKGVGTGSSDTIIVSGVGPLSSSVTYGVEVSGNVGVLGTAITLGEHQINIDIDNGALNDTFRLNLGLVADSAVTITANVLPMPECAVNTDCTYPNEICDGLQQCNSCTSSTQCSFGDICVSGICTEDLSCSINNDCDFPNEVCVSNLCQICTLDSHCGAGNECNSGVCEAIPPAECTSNTQCGYPNEICNVSLECAACTSSSQCNSGDTCEAGVCKTIPPQQCTTNAQCGYPNEICDAGQSCNACITDWQCNTGDACVNSVCVKKYECLVNADCRFPDEVCTLNNTCEQCTVDSQCGGDNTCESGVCTPIPPAECTTNEQCLYPDKVCVDELCILCSDSSQCSNGDTCENGRCNATSPLECTTNEHCNYPNQICNINNTCDICVDNDECNYGDECKQGVCMFEEPKNVTPVKNVSWIENIWEGVSDVMGFDPETVREVVKESSAVAPVAATITLVSSTVVGMSFLNLTLMDAPILLLRGFLGLLTLLGIRSKGQSYGYVYNAISKEPLSSALVRIFGIGPVSADNDSEKDHQKKRLLTTSVTDAFGVFDAELEPGKYEIYVSKSGFGFPSKIVKSLADYPINNLYHGEIFNLEKELQVYYSIPVDPTKQNVLTVVSAVIRERFMLLAKFVQLTLLVFGAVFSAILYVSVPEFVNFAIMLLYVPSIVLTLYSFRHIEPELGVVVDEGGNAVSNLTIGIYDEKSSRFVTKRVSDKSGNFRFVLPKGSYHLDLLNEPYEIVSEEKREIVSKRSKEMTVIASKLVVRRVVHGGEDGVVGQSGESQPT